MLIPKKHTNFFSMGLYHIQQAEHFFEGLITYEGLTGPAKSKVKIYHQRLKFILDDLSATIDPRSADELKAEIKNFDSCSFFNVFAQMLKMDKATRETFEQVAIAIETGEFQVEHIEDKTS